MYWIIHHHTVKNTDCISCYYVVLVPRSPDSISDSKWCSSSDKCWNLLIFTRRNYHIIFINIFVIIKFEPIAWREISFNFSFSFFHYRWDQKRITDHKFSFNTKRISFLKIHVNVGLRFYKNLWFRDFSSRKHYSYVPLDNCTRWVSLVVLQWLKLCRIVSSKVVIIDNAFE